MDSEILHAVKAGMQRFVLEPQNKSLIFAIAFSLALFSCVFAYSCVFASIALAVHFLHHLYLSVFTLSIKKAIEHLNTLSRGIYRRSSRALHGESSFTSYFELTVCIIHFKLRIVCHQISITPIHPSPPDVVSDWLEAEKRSQNKTIDDLIEESSEDSPEEE